MKCCAILPGDPYRRGPENRHLAQNARHVRFFLRDHHGWPVIRLLERMGVWNFCFGRGELYAPLAPEVDARVKVRFRAEVEALEEIPGRDLSAWKSSPQAISEVEPAGSDTELRRQNA